MNLESVFVLLESKIIGDINLLKTGKSLTMIGIIDEQKSSTPTLPSMVKKRRKSVEKKAWWTTGQPMTLDLEGLGILRMFLVLVNKCCHL